MFGLRLVPVILSTLVLGAHFLRSGNMIGVAASLALPFLLLLRNRWALPLVRVALVLAACEWGRALVEIARQRQAAAEPWTRMAAILGGVALFALLAAVVLPARRPPAAPPSAPAP